MKIVFYPSMLLTCMLLSTGAHAQVKTGTKGKSAKAATIGTVEYLPEFSHEVAAQPGSVFKIKNTKYNLEIRFWNEKKIKIVSTLPMDTDVDTLSNDELYELSAINLKAFGKRIDLESTRSPLNSKSEILELVVQGYPTQNIARSDKQSKEAKEVVVEGYRTQNIPKADKQGKQVKEVVVQGYPTQPLRTKSQLEVREINLASVYPSTDTAIKFYNSAKVVVEEVPLSTGSGSWTRTSSTRRNMVVFIPRDCKLVIDNRYTDIVISEDLGTGEFTLFRSNLGTRNIKDLTLEANFYTLYAGNIGRAEMKLGSGSMTAGIIEDAEIESIGSEIDYDGGTSLFLKSQADRINIEEVGSVTGYKQFGELRIGQLLGQLNLEGKSGTIKLRRIATSTSEISISSQFADLRLPLRQLADYTVDFKGDNSTVYSSFDKQVSNANEKIVNSASLVAAGVTFGEKAPAAFKLSSGNTSGKQTIFNINCSGCTVNFK